MSTRRKEYEIGLTERYTVIEGKKKSEIDRTEKD